MTAPTHTKYRCQAVVVGTGAGGAVAASALAEAGIDTIVVEQGDYVRTEDHTDILSGIGRMYLNGGMTAVLGRPMIPLPLGAAVGGTTIINSATCFRPPREKVAQWDGIAYEELEPYLEEIERRIHAVTLDEDLLGRNWNVLKRGCDKRGIALKPLVHNVLDCQGRGRCQFGCQAGAKQSTDIAFIPKAIADGAHLLTRHRVTSLAVDDGRAIGVAGTCPEGWFEVRADSIVLAMGALSGPAFMLKQGVPDASKRLGRGLRIHPAIRVVALFDEIVNGYVGVPQGAYIDHWADRGIMLEGVFTPPGPMIVSLPGAGFEYKALAAQYPNMAAFGAMVSDTGSGYVRPGRLGAPFAAYYQLSQADAESLRFAIARLAELYFAAGAKRVFTNVVTMPELDGIDAVVRFEATPIKPSYLEMMAFHPLGTCTLGADRATSVVNANLECHDATNLYVMDASVIPDSLGVNPQVTVMALALRAARRLADRMNNALRPNR